MYINVGFCFHTFYRPIAFAVHSWQLFDTENERAAASCYEYFQEGWGVKQGSLSGCEGEGEGGEGEGGGYAS